MELRKWKKPQPVDLQWEVYLGLLTLQISKAATHDIFHVAIDCDITWRTRFSCYYAAHILYSLSLICHIVCLSSPVHSFSYFACTAAHHTFYWVVTAAHVLTLPCYPSSVHIVAAAGIWGCMSLWQWMPVVILCGPSMSIASPQPYMFHRCHMGPLHIHQHSLHILGLVLTVQEPPLRQGLGWQSSVSVVQFLPS